MAFDDGPQLGVHGDLGIEIDFLGPFADLDDLATALHVWDPNPARCTNCPLCDNIALAVGQRGVQLQVQIMSTATFAGDDASNREGVMTS